MPLPYRGDYRPDPVWSARQVAAIVRNSGRPESEIAKVEINCGNGGGLGWVVLQSGERHLVR
jgi:hypothetical protein